MQDIARKVMCGALIGGMVALAPVSQAAAESYRKSYPTSQTQTYHSDSRRSTSEPQKKAAESSENSWVGLALIGGLLYLMLNDISLDMSGNSGSADLSRAWLRRGDPQPSNPGSSEQDNGIGCTWGYESMGTCVR
jgi:hypothetical protein